MGHLSVRICFQYGVQATATKEAASPDAGCSHASAQPTLEQQACLQGSTPGVSLVKMNFKFTFILVYHSIRFVHQNSFKCIKWHD
jgi:hypothetical protein